MEIRRVLKIRKGTGKKEKIKNNGAIDEVEIVGPKILMLKFQQ